MEKKKGIFDNIILDKQLKGTLNKIVEWEHFDGSFDEFFIKYTPESLLQYRGMGIGKVTKIKNILSDPNTPIKVSLVEQMKLHMDAYEDCYRKIRRIIRLEIDGYKQYDYGNGKRSQEVI